MHRPGQSDATRVEEEEIVGDERRPGTDAPEVPRVPRAEPELPGRGQVPEREVPAIPRPEPELPGRRPERPEAPTDPNAPGA